MKIALVLIRLGLTMPIWFYLLYKMLQGIEASELMWFLFWIYVPFSITTQIIQDAFIKEIK